MLVLDHVSISVPSIDIARPFYDAIMAALGVDKVYDRPAALGYGARCNASEPFHTYLAIYESATANVDEKRHWCFKATSRAQVNAFYAAGLTTGGKDDGAPGLRPQYHEGYFAAFLLDPFGNRVEAVCHRVE
ncbi:VOC family protein [Noviherbaspirillum denitrificans]|uniref:Glyoxalase n=1 Tax=Noviherbaspirillum denitrificans TaxID=1968433 RepID=A0A254T5V4_9BURK|nr:VOC family protein [Noviherbaspirillum denitrificans]OWW18061.1 glyoxalase [Noviherbaspirillum denitrificans]